MFCVGVLGEPLEDSGFSLGIDSEADGFFHGAIDDCLCDDALLTTGCFFLRFRSPTILR